jgi:hypothetical protein
VPRSCRSVPARAHYTRPRPTFLLHPSQASRRATEGTTLPGAPQPRQLTRAAPPPSTRHAPRVNALAPSRRAARAGHGTVHCSKFLAAYYNAPGLCGSSSAAPRRPGQVGPPSPAALACRVQSPGVLTISRRRAFLAAVVEAARALAHVGRGCGGEAAARDRDVRAHARTRDARPAARSLDPVASRRGVLSRAPRRLQDLEGRAEP